MAAEADRAPVPGRDEIRAAVRSLGPAFDREEILHASVATALAGAGIPFRAEERLSDQDRVDFLIGDIALELKVDGANQAILRQMLRYAESDRVGSLMLLTTRQRHRLPPQLLGKPCEVIRLWPL